MSDVDALIGWLAGVICRPNWKQAACMASYLTKRVVGFDALTELKAAGIVSVDEHSRLIRGGSDRVQDPVVRVAWQLLALRISDAPTMIHSVVSGAIGLLCSADRDTGEARARLRVWEDVARGKYTTASDGDFFEIADLYWRGEMQFIVADHGVDTMRQATHPALNLLQAGRWDDAFGSLLADCGDRIGPERCQALLNSVAQRASVQTEIEATVDYLYSIGTPAAGAWALAWSMLTADPRKPASFYFLPQLQFAIDHADLEEEDDADVRARIRIWWRAAEGEWTGSEVSIFRIADVETRTEAEFPGIDAENVEDLPDPAQHPGSRMSTAATLFADIGLPTLVVMPSGKATKLNNFHAQYKDLVDAALPLVIAQDVARIRLALHAEFPHATVAVDLLLRDMREGRPVTLKPVLLVGSPGCGKSRMVRRLAELTRQFVYRYDAASSSDNQFSGTAKAWSNTEPSVPARAVQQSKSANPIVMLDEIDKAGARNWNGRLWDAILPFLERETAGRYRDQSLDCELDLASVSFIATANDATELPAPLLDRFCIVKVPAPGLLHLTQLASRVMSDLAAEDEIRHGDAPLASDELEVIGRSWAKSGFSMRALQKIVAATLEARDQHAMRH